MPTFCDLPRELRDIIYQQRVREIIDKPQTRHFITSFTGLLMSNKQIGSEPAVVAGDILRSHVQELALQYRQVEQELNVCNVLIREMPLLSERRIVLRFVMDIKEQELHDVETPKRRLEGWLKEVRHLRHILFGETED